MYEYLIRGFVRTVFVVGVVVGLIGALIGFGLAWLLL